MKTTKNLSRPGQEPVDGDTIRITYDNGTVETKQYWADRLVEPKPKPPKEGKDKAAEDLLLKVSWTADDQSDALRLLLARFFP